MLKATNRADNANVDINSTYLLRQNRDKNERILLLRLITVINQDIILKLRSEQSLWMKKLVDDDGLSRLMAALWLHILDQAFVSNK